MVALVIFIVALFQKFIIFSEISGKVAKTFDTYGLKGTVLVGIGIIVIIYGYLRRNTIGSIIGYLLSLGGYSYTFFTLFKLLNSGVNGKKFTDILTPVYGLGFYLYILSAVILIISIFIKNNTDDVDKGNYNVDGIDKDSFILCNMILGIKEIPFNSLVLLKKVDNALSIDFHNGDNVSSHTIPLDSIIDMSISEDLSVSHGDLMTLDVVNSDVASANILLAYSLFPGYPLASMGINSFLDNLLADYEKTDVKTWFIITIKYKQNEEELEIRFKTSKNPKSFVDKLKNME